MGGGITQESFVSEKIKYLRYSIEINYHKLNHKCADKPNFILLWSVALLHQSIRNYWIHGLFFFRSLWFAFAEICLWQLPLCAKHHHMWSCSKRLLASILQNLWWWAFFMPFINISLWFNLQACMYSIIGWCSCSVISRMSYLEHPSEAFWRHCLCSVEEATE